jgi:glycosyltransferase involved in cell wall biosynthesis
MKNILVLTYWSFPDSLIQAYTLPYLKIIKKNLPRESSIFLMTLEKQPLDLHQQKEITQQLARAGIQWVPFSYKPFGIAAFLLWLAISVKLLWIIFTKKINTIHCWATPAGAVGYFLSLFTGRRLVLDSYEPHAEAMVENGTWQKNSIAFKILFWLEKKQSRRAWYFISATEGMREYARTKYGVEPKNFLVKPACVDLNLFSPEKIKNKTLLEELNLTGKIVCIYAGKFGGIYLEDEVFDFLKIAHSYWGDQLRVVLLSSHKQDEITTFCRRSGLDPDIVTLRFVSHDKVVDYMGLADFALTPVKPVPTKRFCTPIKDGEYWAMGLPVVIPQNISDDSQIIEENNIGAILRNFETKTYMDAVQKIDALLKLQSKASRDKIRSIAEKYRSFQIAESVYEKIYRNSSGAQ